MRDLERQLRNPSDGCVQEFARADIYPEFGTAPQARRSAAIGRSLVARAEAVFAEMARPHLPDLRLFRYVHRRGRAPRWDARCPQCGSREHHRLTQLWIGKDGGNKLARKRILHFAPEKAIVPQMRDNPLYEAADLHQTGVTLRVDITQAALPDASYDVVIAHHLLEHVDNDRQALRRYGLLRDEWVTIGTKPFTQAAEHGGV